MDDDDLVIYLITLFTFAVIFLFCYIRHVFTFFERNGIPSAKYPSFPFGNAYEVTRGRIPMFMQLWKFYNRFKRRGCKFGGFYIFLKPAVLVVDSRLTKMVLARNDHFKDLGGDLGELNDELSEKLSSEISKRFRNVCSNVLSRINHEEINFSRMMDEECLEESVQEFFGIRRDELSKYVTSKREKRSVFFIFKKLLSLSYDVYKSYRKKKVFQGLIQKRKENDQKMDDILQLLLDNDVISDEIEEYLNKIISILKISNNLVLFTLYELIHNKEIQDDLRGEILRFKKSKTSIDYKEINEMAFLETVVCETLRKYPVKPFIGKVCRKSFTENDVNFPKDILLFISTFGIHHDPENYTNPELYDPDRFSEENEKFIESLKYLPLGYKSGDTLSVILIKLIMKLSLMELLSKYEFFNGKKTPKSIQFDAEFFEELKFKEDVWLRISTVGTI